MSGLPQVPGSYKGVYGCSDVNGMLARMEQWEGKEVPKHDYKYEEVAEDRECMFCHQRIKEEIEDKHGRFKSFKTIKLSCGCMYLGEPIVSEFACCDSLWRTRKRVDERYASFQRRVERLLACQRKRDEMYRDEACIQSGMEDGRFCTDYYGERAEGPYHSTLYADASKHVLMIRFEDGVEDYEFALDLDVAKDLRKVIDMYIEREETKEKG